MRILLLSILLFVTFSSFSQNIVRHVISSFGNSSSNGGYVISSTTGQPPNAGTTNIQSTPNGDNYILRQGFQQPPKFHNLWNSSISIDVVLTTKISPNPAREHTTIKSDKEISSYSFIDRQGQKVLEEKIKQKEVKINTSFLSAGAYIVQVNYFSSLPQRFQFIKQ